MSTSNHKDFTCDCTGLEYYGKTCDTRKDSYKLLRACVCVCVYYASYRLMKTELNRQPFGVAV